MSPRAARPTKSAGPDTPTPPVAPDPAPGEAKTAAEIEQLRLQVAVLRGTEERAAQRHAIEMRKLELELARSELETEALTMSVAKERREEELTLADWRYDRTINFVGEVEHESVQAAIEKLHQFHRMDPGCAITITFNSPGGSVLDGMALFDYVRFLRDAGHRVTIIALGHAASMAGILLQAADVRVMARGSWLLIHEVAFGAKGKIGEIEDFFEFGKRLKEQAASILVERSGGKLAREVLEARWGRKDWWLSADEALALGLIDEIR